MALNHSMQRSQLLHFYQVPFRPDVEFRARPLLGELLEVLVEHPLPGPVQQLICGGEGVRGALESEHRVEVIFGRLFGFDGTGARGP